jgi:3-phosphoshikimate 1-carboxyvinyltransferase
MLSRQEEKENGSEMKHLPYQGFVRLAGSKSVIQRYLLMATFNRFETILKPGSLCDDVREMASAARKNGVKISISAERIVINSLQILPKKDTEVKFTASATALRFWLARAVYSRGKSVILISEALANRPLKPFLDRMEALGCKIIRMQSEDPKFPHRLEITPPKAVPDSIETDAKVSSQFISGLMLSAGATGRFLHLNFRSNPVSYDFLVLTEYTLNSCNVYTCISKKECLVKGSDFAVSPVVKIEPELSAGAFLMALGTFSEKGVGFYDPVRTYFQPDWEIGPILRSMKAKVMNRQGVWGVKYAPLTGTEYEMDSFPDLVPLVAVLALFASSPTTLKNISRLKYKESDRIKGILTAFEEIGARYLYSGKTLVVFPYDETPPAVTLDTQNDHRLVMAFLLLHLHFPQVKLSETKSVRKSYPGFFEMLRSIRIDR